MVIGFDKLGSVDFALSDIGAIHQQPLWRRLDMRKRRCNGFVYVVCGQCRFTSQSDSFTLSEGGLAYLPLTSQHILEVLSPQFRFYRVDFTLTVNGERALFSTEPIKLTDEVSPECAKAISQLERVCSRQSDTVQKNALLCQVFAQLQERITNPCSARLMPALRYLQENLNQPLDGKHLAELCFLSTTRFYHLFRQSFGMTPQQYRDRLLTDRAIMLLKLGDLRINEIAQLLGFDDPAYFSRFFRKHTGCSPRQFMTGRSRP